MKTLDEIFTQYRHDCFIAKDLDLDGKAIDLLAMSGVLSKQQVKDIFLELIGDVEQRETDDMSLKSWTPDDYKAFGKNELKVELYRKAEHL